MGMIIVVGVDICCVLPCPQPAKRVKKNLIVPEPVISLAPGPGLVSASSLTSVQDLCQNIHRLEVRVKKKNTATQFYSYAHHTYIVHVAVEVELRCIDVFSLTKLTTKYWKGVLGGEVMPTSKVLFHQTPYPYQSEIGADRIWGWGAEGREGGGRIPALVCWREHYAVNRW